jgi:hypothetical protein
MPHRSVPSADPPCRRRTPALTLGSLLLLLGAAACESGRIGGPEPEPGNINFLLGAAVVESDTGIVVDGRSVVRHPSNGQALWLDRFDHRPYGGFPELDYPQSAHQSLAWRISLKHQPQQAQQGDSMIFRFVDHGETQVARTAMEKHTDLPHFTPGLPIRFENFISYFTQAYVHVDWWQGGSTTFHRAPYFDDLLAGAPLVVETSGSAEAEPVTATFSARPFAELKAIANGAPIPQDGAMPVVSVNESFALEFNRSLDPARAFIILIPFRGVNGKRAFIQPISASQRVVIPSSALRELSAGSSATRLAYTMIIIEVHVQDNVFTGRLRNGGGEFSLPFVQRSETAMHFYLER